MNQGKLFLIPSQLDDEYPDVLPATSIDLVHSIRHFVVENEKSARKFLKLIGIPIAQDKLSFFLLNEHGGIENLPSVIKILKDGFDIGLLSDAGCPGIADPGSDLVRMAHEKGIRVTPLIGPSSIFLSLMSSGLNGQSFCFHGYLPRETKLRQQKIRELEKIVNKTAQTQIFIETPYRNMQMLKDLLENCQDDIKLCLACNVTGKKEIIQTKEIRSWKKSGINLHKMPCVFLLGK